MSSSATENRAGFIPWIDVLRALAMIGIFGNHFLEACFGKWDVGALVYLGWPDVDWPPLAERFEQLRPLIDPSASGFGITWLKFTSFLVEQTTSLFLLLNGFMLAYSLSKLAGGKDYGQVLWKRAKRLYPLWWTAYAVILFPLAVAGMNDLTLLDPNFYWKLLGIQWSPDQMFYGIPSWWYVPCLLQLFLLAWPLWILLRKTSHEVMLLVAVGIGWAFRSWVLFRGLEYVNPWGSIGLVCLPEFALGLYLGEKFTTNSSDAKQFSSVKLLFALAVLLFAIPLSGTKAGMIVVPLLRAGALWISLGFAARAIASSNKQLLLLPLAWIGKHCYAIYLSHHFVMLVLMKVAPFHADWPTSKKTIWFFGLLGMCLIGTFIFSCCLELILSCVQRMWRALTIKLGTTKATIGTGLLLAGCLAGIVVGDNWVRNHDPQEVAEFGWGERPSLSPHEIFGWTLKPNSETRLRWDSYDYTVKANSLGFPGPEPASEKRPNVFRIMVMGDAFASAEGVDTAQAWPRLLETEWNSEQDQEIEVLNFSITGYGPQQYAAVAQEYIGKFQPDLVIVALFVNDFEDVAYSNEEFQALIGFDKPAPDSWQGRLTGQQLFAYVKRQIKERLVRDVLKRPTGQAAMFCQFDAMDKSLVEEWQKPQELVTEYLAKIKQLATQYDGSLLIVGVPVPSQIGTPEQFDYWPDDVPFPSSETHDYDLPQQRMQAIADELGAPFVDLRPPLLEVREQQPYFAGNWHWTKVGHQVVAEFLRQKLTTDIGMLTEEPLMDADFMYL